MLKAAQFLGIDSKSNPHQKRIFSRLVTESVAAVRSPGDDTDNGDTGDNAEDNGYHLEIISLSGLSDGPAVLL